MNDQSQSDKSLRKPLSPEKMDKIKSVCDQATEGIVRALKEQHKNMQNISSIQKIFESNNFRLGRLLGYSKSVYRFAYPDDKIYFNANIFTSDGKVWYGDLNLTQDEKELKKIAKEIGKELFILDEYSGRFVDKPVKELLQLAVFNIKN